MRRRIRFAQGLLAICVIAFAGCQKKAEEPPKAAAPPPPPPFHVTELALGKSLTAEHKIATPATTFGVKDTIYAVVGSVGVSKGVLLRARWTYVNAKDTLLVSADSQTVAPTGPAWSEFHVSKSTHWPKGHYAVTVMADTVFAGSQPFEVK
jgi:hypothetical protein